MTVEERLVQIASALDRVGLKFLIMGGHAVRYYGVSRDTFDFDFHTSLSASEHLSERLRQSGLFGSALPAELPSWRQNDFRRFSLGKLPDGKEELLEFWMRNHLLAPFEELYERREEGEVLGCKLPFLALPDLIRSKETEREDDWRDVSLLEEILDNRHHARAKDRNGQVSALANLRSRRGYRRAELAGWLVQPALVAEALNAARHPITRAFLIPFAEPTLRTRAEGIPDLIAKPLQKVKAGSDKHLALVEAFRRWYQQQARAADRADKARIRRLAP